MARQGSWALRTGGWGAGPLGFGTWGRARPIRPVDVHIDIVMNVVDAVAEPVIIVIGIVAAVTHPNTIAGGKDQYERQKREADHWLSTALIEFMIPISSPS
jgi:hypothetical protein